MDAEVMKVTDLIEIASRVVTTGLMGYKIDMPTARCILGVVQALREEKQNREAMFVTLLESYALLEAADRMQDWPQDTVLGEGGVQNIQDLQTARGTIGAVLSMVEEKERNEIVTRVMARRKEHADRMRKRMAALRAERHGAEEKS